MADKGGRTTCRTTIGRYARSKYSYRFSVTYVEDTTSKYTEKDKCMYIQLYTTSADSVSLGSAR